ncbi:LytTR family DNA-binding domain-containing protein [Emticicia sp. BO119]|uniref:LytR/AlgR family response regulator transcription factor n=1 Tax=Emticicia sp. BO119 TaxID=2757768 RepID=UPI0015F03E6B|nr:LytTR family DNA-binding domain-containing protein [Emticicia sp. BO119]MBA4848780.1 LytTR family transcriptional regulator DNA-binding domain-containing protein [Emticicia sp. BO119]
MKQFNPYLSRTNQVTQNLFILVNGNRKAIQPQDIIYLEADINYTIFHTRHSKFITAFHLKFFDAALKEHSDFIRINKSYILNVNYLQDLRWKKAYKEARLINGERLTISRRKASGVKEILYKKINDRCCLNSRSET